MREGASRRPRGKLRLSQPTISAQIRQLEESLGERLFQKQGRTLVPTDVGRVVFRYADEIFGIGRELMETLRGRPHRALEAVHLVCREDSTERLLVELATHALDVVITDMPAPATVRVKAFSHLLGESDTAFFAPASMAARLRRRGCGGD